MKLRPTQIAGLGAIVVFGGILIVTLMRGPRDPDLLPSGVRISDLPNISAPAIDTTPLPADPMAIGSQEAKDDLYCSGVVFAKQTEATGTPPEQAERERNAYAALAEGGRAKLIAEAIVKEDGAIAAGNAWAAKAREDFRAGSPRLSFEACMARAAALPAKPN
jgi:hypothetical protein